MPLTQKIESAFSRVANGNFSNHFAFWEGNFGNELEADEGTGYGEPHFRAVATGDFRHHLQYRDLAVYPSPLYFKNGILVPLTLQDALVYDLKSVDPQFHPFDYLVSGTTRKAVPSGSWVMVDTGHTETSGECRVGKVYDSAHSSLTRGTAKSAKIVGSPTVAKYIFLASNMFKVKITDDLSKVKRLDGTYGIKMGDYFVGKNPDCGGSLYGIVGNEYYFSALSWHPVPPVVSVYKQVQEWEIVEPELVSITRVAPAALYDLTLCYTLRSGYAVNPENIRIRCYDEMDNLVGEIGPVAVDGTVKYFVKQIGTMPYYRFVQRFMAERETPFYGRFEIFFPQPPAGVTRISDVGLYRGNFTDRFLRDDTTSVESYDMMETPVAVESEIIPRGTIIAYAGGSACPQGFMRVEGIGRKDMHDLNEPYSLYDDWTDMNHEYRSHEVIYPVSADEPRTLLQLTGHTSRARWRDSNGVQQSLPYQIHGRFEPVVPFTSDDPNVQRIRAEVGNPTPIWVNETYKRVDLLPGYVIEFEIPEGASFRYAYAIVTQYAEGTIVTRVYEDRPYWPFFKSGDARRRAERQVNAGAPRNTIYKGYGFYGDFFPETEDVVQLELLGDWDHVVKVANERNAKVNIWKCGVVAHAQVLPELGAGTPGKGGLSYFGEPHSHDMPEGDSTDTKDFGQSGNLAHLRIPTKHYHGYLFGAVTIPKVRPVLLCQKV